MDIDINQKKISIGDKYEIFVDGQQSYNAASKIFRWLAEINLYTPGDERPIMTVKKRFSFYTSYDIIKSDESVFEFRTKSFWKGHYYCNVGSDLYEIYAHRGRKFSVYKNDRQVAWWTKKAVTWFNGDNYKITADKDVDKELIISFCLVVDSAFSNDNKKSFNVSVGKIGPQAKKFDPTWQPKY